MKFLSNEEIDKNHWNSLVDGKAMHRYEWHNIISKTYGLQPFYALAVEDGRYALIGSFKTQKGLISLPFVSHSGYASNDMCVLNALKESLAARGLHIDARNVIPLEQNPHYVTSVITIESIDEYWKSLSTNMRNQIRKSQAFGFETAFSRAICDYSYDLYARAMHRLGTPAHKRLFFDKILEYIPESFVITVSDRSKVVGFMLCVYDNDTLYDLFAATNPDYNIHYANYHLYYEAISKAATLGLKHFDMGRSTYESSVHKFKQKWKSTDYPIVSSVVYSKGGSLGIMSRLWQKLPYVFTLWLGPKIRKYLP